MKRGVISYRKRTTSAEKRAWLRQWERDYHVRAFGEELARVNLDMTIAERRRYLAWMRETAERAKVAAPPGKKK